jgi:hypothetical protein
MVCAQGTPRGKPVTEMNPARRPHVLRARPNTTWGNKARIGKEGPAGTNDPEVGTASRGGQA